MDFNLVPRFVDFIDQCGTYFSRSYTFREVDLKGFIGDLIGLQTGVSNILCLNLRPVLHLVVFAVRGLGMIMFLGAIDFFSIRLGGHFQDHSVMGRSAVRNAMAGILVNPGIHYDHRLVVFRFQQPVIPDCIDIQ